MIVLILQHTPAWVWLLLLALIYLGYLQSKTRTVPKARLFALPATMLGLSLYSLFATFGATLLGFAAWLAGGIVVGLLYRVLQRPAAAGYAPDTRVYTIRGSWLPLTLMLAIFLTRYAVAVAIAIDASLRQANSFVLVAGLAYGCMSCAFAARAYVVVRAAGQAPPGLASQST